ncbi:MAG: hypothetical protein Q7T78_04480 [Rhodoferax sp.]|nr:hypothetical protein [Rhodoferax sp.]
MRLSRVGVGVALKLTGARLAAAYFFAFLRAGAGFLTVTGFSSLALGASPISVLTGQILKAGHFWHPTAKAMGQSVIAFSC